MQRDRSDEADDQRSRPSSRRSSVSLPRKNSLRSDKDKKTPSPSHSAQSTPKKQSRPSLDFMVTGKQILKRVDRANSLPAAATSSTTSTARGRARRISETEERASPDDMSLHFSQMSDFEEGQVPLATSTPKPYDDVTGNHTTTACNHATTTVDGNHTTTVDGNHTANLIESHRSVERPGPARQKPRSASLQHLQARGERRTPSQQSVDSARRSELPAGRSPLPAGRADWQRDTFSCSRDSLFRTSSSASPHRYGTDCSSLSAEGSPSSAEPSPLLSSCCSHSWAERTVAGEWSSFWAEYGSGRAGGQYCSGRQCCAGGQCAGRGYDPCPTPYADDSTHEMSDRRPLSPTDSLKQISDRILREGLRLAPQEARTVIQCAHLLGSVLSRAVERSNSREDRRRTLTLNLKTDPPENTRAQPETHEVTTQTDISLPNTKSAPKIFENILRQLSKSSIDEPDLDKLTCDDASGK